MLKFMSGFFLGMAVAIGITWFGFDAAKDFAREKMNQGVASLNEARYDACRRKFLESTGCFQKRSQEACEADIRAMCSEDNIPFIPAHKEPAAH